MAGRPKSAGATGYRLSEETIVRSARRIIQEVGVAGLSMRVLSDDLRVSLGATYHHVPNRQVLLRLVAHDIYRDLELPERDQGDWTDHICLAIIRFVELLNQYPGMASEIAHDLGGMTPDALAAFVRERLDTAGFSEKGANTVLATLFFYVIGITLSGQLVDPAGVDTTVRDQYFEPGLRLVLRGASELP
jgi:AcrR family transcriptional regulator